jgi:peptidoglycan/xylan/chitin deacetylase (PgdA/CDA1 family)
MKNRPIRTLYHLFHVLRISCRRIVTLKPTPLPQLSLLPPPTITPDSRLVAIHFDDGWRSQYEQALPVLLKYGFRATFAIITNHIGERYDSMKSMNEKEIKELARYGMEIASHTRNHPILTGKLSDRRLRREIFDSKRDLETMGFTVSTLVYPLYEYNDKVIEYVRAAGYVCARGGWSIEGAYDITTGDFLARYHITAWHITNQDMASFKLIVDKANRNSAVCLVYHILSDTGTEENAIAVVDFCAQMAYLYNNGYTAVLLPELLKQYP